MLKPGCEPGLSQVAPAALKRQANNVMKENEMEQYDFGNMERDLVAAVKADPVVPQTWTQLADAVKAEARKCKRAADREYRGSYLRPRELQVLACNDSGRVDRCEPIFNNTSAINGKWLREQVRYIKAQYPDATLVGIDGGFDLFESFQDYLAGFDYEPCIEVWEIEVPKALFDAA